MKKASILLFLTALALSLLTLLPCAFAQESEADGEEPAVTADADSEAIASRQLTFSNMLRSGGWTMWPLGACSLLGIGLAIYNGIIIRPGRMLKVDVVDQVKTALSDLDIEHARSLCSSHPAPVTNILQAGLDRIRGGELHLQSVEKGMEEYSMQEMAGHMQPINSLSVIATISPMIGLLGTVSGMIKAFQAMALGGMGRPELLADNISEALITTATGLIIGIPIMVLYFYFRNRFTGIVAAINRSCGDVLETLDHASRTAPQG